MHSLLPVIAKQLAGTLGTGDLKEKVAIPLSVEFASIARCYVLIRDFVLLLQKVEQWYTSVDQVLCKYTKHKPSKTNLSMFIQWQTMFAVNTLQQC